MQLNMILQQANNIIFYHCIYQTTNKYKNIPGWSIFFILFHSFLFFFFFLHYILFSRKF